MCPARQTTTRPYGSSAGLRLVIVISSGLVVISPGRRRVAMDGPAGLPITANTTSTGTP